MNTFTTPIERPKKRKLGPSLATFAVWGVAFAWLGWRGLTVAVIAGTVMSIGTLINAGLLHGRRRPS